MNYNKFTDYELMKMLDEAGYEPTRENVNILRENNSNYINTLNEFTDYELMQMLDEAGYEPNIEAVQSLREATQILSEIGALGAHLIGTGVAATAGALGTGIAHLARRKRAKNAVIKAARGDKLTDKQAKVLTKLQTGKGSIAQRQGAKAAEQALKKQDERHSALKTSLDQSKKYGQSIQDTTASTQTMFNK